MPSSPLDQLRVFQRVSSRAPRSPGVVAERLEGSGGSSDEPQPGWARRDVTACRPWRWRPVPEHLEPEADCLLPTVP
ncbi:MAG: hypothetical protein H6741_10650 [Alphaproteobacteria bacterium]|nr:hypothetical protein [Alphaproteobacteria bacterium]